MLKSMLVGGIVGVLGLSLSLPVCSQIEPNINPLLETSQAKISPLEMRQYAQILQQFKGIEYRTQQKMAQAIKKGGLSYERFLEIGKNQNNYNYTAGVQASPDELEKFQKTLVEVEKIISETEDKKKRMIKSQGLELQRFQQIETIIAQDRNLQQKLQQMVQ
ncbi:MAG TPA: DUF4168 domain-containing protein [Cyanothece sp. UBA12306]|nr:DUF4168 domain-containing protein [Cyanothece sp. UBA12306]